MPKLVSRWSRSLILQPMLNCGAQAERLLVAVSLLLEMEV